MHPGFAQQRFERRGQRVPNQRRTAPIGCPDWHLQSTHSQSEQAYWRAPDRQLCGKCQLPDKQPAAHDACKVRIILANMHEPGKECLLSRRVPPAPITAFRNTEQTFMKLRRLNYFCTQQRETEHSGHDTRCKHCGPDQPGRFGGREPEGTKQAAVEIDDWD
jgi:hypothetical protein